VSDRIGIRGGAPLTGTLRLPGCKGVSHRAAVAAALADGTSEIANLAPGQDVARTLAVLRALGVAVADAGPGRVRVTGRGPDGLGEATGVLDCGNSGTTMRVVAGLAAGRSFLSVLTGDDSLTRRPMARVVAPLRAMGAHVDGRDGGRFAPLVVRGGGLRGVRHELEVASGQVKTALVFAGLQADGVTEIVEPAPSRDHTERLLRALGAPVESVDPRTTRVRAGGVTAFDLEVPGDPSAAAFFAVAAAVVPGSHVVLEGVLGNPGRIGYLDVLAEMGAVVTVHDRGERAGEPVVDVEVAAGSLRGTRIRSHEGIVDELPVLAVAAAFADGPTEIVDAAELRVKESDRIATLATELARLGVVVEPRPDGLVIGGRAATPAVAPTFESHGDHRIAMAAAVAAAAGTGRSEVGGWDAVAVSYPGFAADLVRLGGVVE
jgi:3-phosphoshikimate 1-carboxyvinyltransferase